MSKMTKKDLINQISDLGLKFGLIDVLKHLITATFDLENSIINMNDDIKSLENAIEENESNISDNAIAITDLEK